MNRESLIDMIISLEEDQGILAHNSKSRDRRYSELSLLDTDILADIVTVLSMGSTEFVYNKSREPVDNLLSRG